MDTLASCLKAIFDETGIYSRKEWAIFLFVSEATLSQWTKGDTAPRPDHLHNLVEELKKYEHQDKVTTVLERFYVMADMPIEKVVKDPKSLKGSHSISAYLVGMYVSNLKLQLSRVPGKYQSGLASVIGRLISATRTLSSKNLLNLNDITDEDLNNLIKK